VGTGPLDFGQDYSSVVFGQKVEPYSRSSESIPAAKTSTKLTTSYLKGGLGDRRSGSLRELDSKLPFLTPDFILSGVTRVTVC
jgi:hypothetical protein